MHTVYNKMYTPTVHTTHKLYAQTVHTHPVHKSCTQTAGIQQICEEAFELSVYDPLLPNNSQQPVTDKQGRSYHLSLPHFPTLLAGGVLPSMLKTQTSVIPGPLTGPNGKLIGHYVFPVINLWCPLSSPPHTPGMWATKTVIVYCCNYSLRKNSQ